MSDAITISGVSKRFGGVVAVDDLDLSVPRGSLYGFIGPNGSGKTTTLRMIMHILLPDSGEIEVLGERGTRAAHDRVSYLPEERGLYKRMTVRRLLRYYGALKGARQPELDREIDAWLDRLGLSAWLDKKVEALSKGMAQKIQFIAGVLNRPELLILDEPFTGLDPVNAEVVKDAVLDLRKAGTTVVFSTHDMSVAERLCDRIFMIFRGRKVLDGTLDEIQFDLRPRYDPGADGGRDARLHRPGRDRGDQRPGERPGGPVAGGFPGPAGRAHGPHPRLPVRDRAAVAPRHLRPHRRARDRDHPGVARPCVLI